MGKQSSGCWVSTTFLWCSLHLCVCGLKPTCAGMHHHCHSCAACYSRKGPALKGAHSSSLTHSSSSSSTYSRHPLCSLLALTAGLTPFPLSAPRYNVTCHQGLFHLRQDPAAGCPMVKRGVILSGCVVRVAVQSAGALIGQDKILKGQLTQIVTPCVVSSPEETIHLSYFADLFLSITNYK